MRKFLRRALASRQVLGLGMILIVAVAGGCWCWSDFCLWRAESNLAHRRYAAADRWIGCSLWGRELTPQVCLLQLRLARRRGRYREFEQLFKTAEKLRVPIRELVREQRLALVQTQQFDEVSAHWPELLSDPRDDEPEIARAYVIWASTRQRIDDALHVIGLWEKDYPQDPEPVALRGQLSQAMNYWDGAADAYRKALTLAPENNDYRFALATVLQNRMELDEALSLFQKCVERSPDHLGAVRGLAETYVSKGELDKAISTLGNALKRFPDDIDLHQALGEAYLAQGDSADAVSHLERTHDARPENADVAYSLARALKAVKRDSEADPLFEFVAESRTPLNSLKSLHEEFAKNPNNLDLLYQMAIISAKYKSRQEAIRWLEKILFISPTHRAAHEAISDLYELTGQPEKAANHRKIAATLPRPKIPDRGPAS